jgi:hypothetical protein
MMRTLVTFVLRLWVDSQAEGPAWEGQVECVTDGERTYVRGREDLAQFVEAYAAQSAGLRQEQPTDENGGVQ